MKAVLSALIILSAYISVYAQKKTKLDSLESARLENYKKIDALNQFIIANSRNKELTITELQAQQVLLERHRKQIQNIRQQKEWLIETIASNQKLIEVLEQDLSLAQQNHDRELYELSKLENQPKGLLSVEGLNAILQKKKSHEQVRARIAEQIRYIEQVSKQLIAYRKQHINLEQRLKAAEALLQSEIAHEEKRQKDLKLRLRRLAIQEKDIVDQKKSLERFNEIVLMEINNISAQEKTNFGNSKSVNKEVRAVASQPADGNKNNMQPEQQNTNTLIMAPAGVGTAKVFAENKSMLPWPVEKFTHIANHFGIHNHPLATNVQVENIGIDIGTARNEHVRAIFEGKVRAIKDVPGIGWTVFIQHGDYITVYAGLQNVQVKVDSHVKTKAVIGTVGNNKDGYPVLQFQIWKNRQKLNPEEWLAKSD
ncbi:murein hydrolase activator EnvC family protein [Rhodoflexus sp.]